MLDAVTSDPVSDKGSTPSDEPLPRIPASAGALLWNRKGRLLVLDPTYKGGWTLPGGVMEADGETPWEACRREVCEECGIEVITGELAAVDFLRPRPGRPGGLRLLFDCGVFDDDVFARIVLQPEEIARSRLVKPKRALELLSRPVRRRVAAVLSDRGRVHYLEDGVAPTR
jgi:ADP-ribose pyrophosphatase YjhB (NUDIX family)